MRIIIPLIVLLTFFQLNQIFSQPINKQVNDVVIPSPNVSSLGKFIDNPVDYSSGVPSISLPIHTLSYGSLQLPISLNYHAGGVKIAETSSWVGLNWNLNAGGSVSRTVVGIPDDDAFGYYSYGATMSNQLTGSCQYYCGLQDIDTEPDIFNVSYPEGSFKFYFSHDQKLIKIQKDNDDSIKLISNPSDVFSGFLVMTTKGTQYLFGKNLSTDPSNTEVTDPTSNGNNLPYKTTWYLSKITSNDNKFQITFNYTAENLNYKTKASRQYNYSSNTEVGTTGYSGSGNGQDIALHPYWNNIVTGQRLTSIATNEETVTFFASTARLDLSGNRLDSIAINNTSFCKRFIMNYSYFEDNNYTLYDYSRRLQLNSVFEKSCDNTIIKPPFTFEYFGDVINGKIFLPHRLSNQTDHWGYYNGKTINENNEVNVPNSSVAFGFSGSIISHGNSNREVDSIFSIKGTLKKINYPTGGNTSFEFSPNFYSGTFTDSIFTYSTCNTCSTPGPSCCGPLNNSVNVTFPTASAANTASFDLAAVANPVNYPNNCSTQFGVSVVISAWNGATQIGNNFSFSLAQNQFNGGVYSIPLSVFGAFSPNVIYTFKLVSNNGRGDLKIKYYTIQQLTQNKLGPGLRVRKITKNDGLNIANDIVYRYDYNQLNSTFSSASIPTFLPQYITHIKSISYAVLNPDNTYTIYNIGELATWSDTPVVPLSDFVGNSIVYTRVSEFISGNGKKVIIYNGSNVNPIQNSLPSCTTFSILSPIFSKGLSLPFVYNGVRGKILSESIYNESNVLLSQTNYNYVNENYQVNSYMFKNRKFSCTTVSNGGGTLLVILRNPYKLNSCRTLTSSIETIKDGVTTVQNFKYDALKRHSMPISQSFVNSDNKTYKDSMVYIYDYADINIKQYMLGLNMKASPFKTLKYADNGNLSFSKVDGSETEFAWYNLASGAFQTTSTSAFPRPYKIYRDEYTWNASNILTGANKVLQTTIDSFDSYGNIAKMTQFGWSPERFEWNANGTLKKRTFNSHIKQYTYYTSTALLNTLTDIDGQVVTYEYDKLSRVNKIRQRANNVVTEVFYNFKSISDPNNWMKVRKTMSPVTGSAVNIIEDIQYIDGLGRPLQTVKKNQANGLKDLVLDAVAYDNKGRVVKKYLPFQSALSTGAIQAIPGGQGFTMIDYEPSPLNRLSTQTPPGWYPTTMSYGSNAANEVKLTYGTSPTYYAAGLLTKETKTDASNRVMITYKDKKGRVILSKNTKVGATATEVADTYTTYDDKDRVKTVYPPESNSSLTGLVFDYRYDQGDNMIYKKVPDQAAVDMVYNDMDLMTYYKDGNLGSTTYNENSIADQWMMTKYDSYGRPTGTGFYTSATVPAGNNDITAFTKQISWLTYGTTGIEKGKMKSSESLILGNYANATTKIMESYTYDTYGRVSSKLGNNHLNTGTGSQISYYTYDFLDGVLKDSTIQTTPAGSHKYVTRQTFDYIGRPLDTYHRIVTGTVDNGEKHLSTLGYNYQGEVISKLISRGNYAGPPVAGQTYLQKTDFTYNAQGWLTKINDPFLSGTADPLNPDYYDVFRLDLSYDTAPTAVASLTPTLDKSGNISQMTWQNRGQDVMGYNFDYNYLGQIRNSKYFDVIGTATSGTYSQKYDENLMYDNRGNILSLYRNTINGAGMLNIDNLTYGYTAGSNRLATVTDATANAQGFNPMGGSGYTYDLNGNTYANSYKQITDTKYYFNNLPKDITVNQGVNNINKIRFTYDASGRKLRKQVLNNANSVTYQQDYFGKIEYTGTTPTVEAIYHPEGRAVWNGSTWRYEFNVTDHLGNVRAVLSDIDNNKIIKISTDQTLNEIINVNSYYPFGLVMGGTFSNNTVTPDTRYQYNGKEMNSDLGLNLLDYGARWYDGSIGRFTSIDPMAHKYSSLSPYAYVANNPLKFIDPDGRTIIGTDGKPVTYEKKDGEIVWSKNASADTKTLGNAMLKTEKGEQSFNSWQSSKTEVNIKIDTKKEGPNGVLGETKGGKLNEDGQYKKIDVVIYSKSIESAIAENSGTRFENASFEETLGTVGVHEEAHNNAEQIQLDRNSENELEQDVTKNKPINAEIPYREQYHQKNPNLPNASTWRKQYDKRGYKGF